jgi:Fe-S-cluster containining protein
MDLGRIRFQCQGSGNCCVSRGGYGHVYLTPDDRRKMAAYLGMRTSAFTRRYCDQKNGVWKLKDSPGPDCRFLKDHRCTVYAARPTQCRTWPFWPEVLNPKVWNREVARFCPGVGKGPLWAREEVEKQLDAQIASEKTYGQ